MRKISVLIFSFFILFACNERVEKTVSEILLSSEETMVDPVPKEEISADGRVVEIFDFENFKPYLEKKDSKIHVINFWATWCKPCVAELPAFEALGASQPEIEVTLVSLDFLNAIESSLIPFIIKNDLKSEVIVLNDPDGNSWIPQVDENWSGAIPATIIYKNEKSLFYGQSFSLEELEHELTKFK